MNNISSFAVPFLLLIIFASAALTKTAPFTAFTEGAAEGLKTMIKIFPSLLALIVAIEVMNRSGLTDALTSLFSPVFSFLGIPGEITPLVLLRPVSGSGSTAVLKSILDRFTPDSFAGRCACVIAGGTETTFYTLAVYFAAAKATHTRHSVVCAVIADIVCVMAGCAVCRLYFR